MGIPLLIVFALLLPTDATLFFLQVEGFLAIFH